MRIAAVTMVYDEDIFLPLWLNYYGACFSPENLFVIDDGSTDGSTGNPLIRNLVSKKRALLDEDDRAALVSHVHEALLGVYDVVIYTDVDEFIVIDPDAGMSLTQYLSTKQFACTAPIGFEVIHRREREAGIDFLRPLFEQRRFVRFDVDYSKPAISRRPIRWGPGFHRCDLKYKIDCNIILFHLRSVDYELSRRRIAKLNRVRFSQSSIENDYGWQFRLDQEQYLAFLYGSGDTRFEDATERELDAMFLAYIRTGDRSLSTLNPHWSSRIKLDLAAAEIASQAGPKSSPIAPQQLERLFQTSLERMIRGRPERARNEPCPCGSRRRFKHCHAVNG